jgi:hypothetical protein
MWYRREVVFGGALTVLFGGTSRCFCFDRSAPHSAGCHLNDRDVLSVYPHGTETQAFYSGNESIILKSGDLAFDYALAQTLFNISQRFGVVPGFAYFDDSASKNAFATPVTRMPNSDGTVLMGTGLLAQLKKMPVAPEVAIAGVCSHEFGHVVQFKYGLIDKVDAGQPTVKRSELQADYFAGFFTGLRKLEKPTYPSEVVVATMHNFGDLGFGDPQHHGTPEERGLAVMRGFAASYYARKSLGDAVEESTNYVLAL